MSPSDPCPACPSLARPVFLERHLDHVGGRSYELFRCPDCGVVFSQPRQAVGADWYEKAAPIRALEGRGNPARDWRYRMFIAEGFAPGKLLDVGCGDGGFLMLVKALGFSVCGFDYETRMIELARAQGVADAQAAEFGAFCRSRRDHEFDYVTMFDVLEHTPEPSWFLAQIKRLLKSGGIVAITLPNAARPLPWRREEHDYPPHHFTRWSASAMRAFLERHGFEVIHQNASRLTLRYLADHFFFYRLMPAALGAARRWLFGRGQEKTISELYAEKPNVSGRAAGALSDKLRRQRLVNALKTMLAPLTWSVALCQFAYYKGKNSECGECLYTVARLAG